MPINASSFRRSSRASGAVLTGLVLLAAAGCASTGSVRAGRASEIEAPVTASPDTTGEPVRPTLPTLPPLTTAPRDAETDDTNPDDTNPEDTSPDRTAPDVTAPDLSGALPMGDPERSTVVLDSVYDDSTWSVRPIAFVDVGTSEYSEAEGRCVLLLGTMTATSIDEGTVTNGYAAPDATLFVERDGAGVDAVDDTTYDCDTGPAIAAGWSPADDATITAGTEYAFFREFLLDGDRPEGPVAVTIGADGDGDGDGNGVVFVPTFVEALPAAPRGAVGDSGASRAPLGDGGATFDVAASYGDLRWSGVVQGMVEGPLSPFDDGAGRCFTIYGQLVPAGDAEGAVVPGSTTPRIGLIVAGRYLEGTSYDCDTEAIEAAGYGSAWDASVTPGTTYAFYQHVLVRGSPEATADLVLDAIVVGEPTGDAAAYMEPTIADAVTPPPPGTVGPLDETLLAIGDPGTFTFTGDFGDVSWSGTVLAMIDAPPSEGTTGSGRCLVVVGSIAAEEVDDGGTTDSYDLPALGVIAAGHLADEDRYQCDVTAAEAAGYAPLADASLAVGETYDFVTAVMVPDPAAALDALVVGDAREGGAVYFTPTVATELPPAG